MQLNNLFKVSVLATALVIAGFGGDINVTPTVNDNSVDNSVTDSNNTNNTTGGDDGGASDNPCATYGERVGAFDGLDCTCNPVFASKNVQITENLTFAELENGGVHLLQGALQIGQDCDTTTTCTINQNGPVMTVDAGAVLAFDSGESIVRIARGAKLNASGTAEKPVVFTSANAFDRLDVEGNGPRFADWGGIIINGFGITNACTDAKRDAQTCNVPSEGTVSNYGGNNNADDSGSMSFAKIWYAGSGPRDGGDGDDLNSLTLNGVGPGSLFDYIHIHQGFDDGIEFFGGAADIKHVVVTDTQDDSIDMDSGWQGRAQFLYLAHGTVDVDGVDVFMGNGGFEADGEKNAGPDYSQAPTSAPKMANVTIVTTDGLSVRDNDPSIALKFDDNFSGDLYNFLLVKTDASVNNTACVFFTSDGDAAVNAGQLDLDNSVMACVNEFAQDTTFADGTTRAAWFDNEGSNERIGGAATVFAADGFSTDMTSADITITANDLAVLNDDFFETVDFVGAVSNQDTTSDWYQWVQDALDAASRD